MFAYQTQKWYNYTYESLKENHFDMKLSLLNGVNGISGLPDTELDTVTDNCFEAYANTLMFCCSRDPLTELQAAYARGCRIFCLPKSIDPDKRDSVFIFSDDPKSAYSALLDKIHGYPSDKIFKIAVCGNKSRSLTALTLYATLRYLGHRCLYIGRNGISADRSSFVKEAAGIAKIKTTLHSAVAAGIKYAIIECNILSELGNIDFDLAVCPDGFENDTLGSISHRHLITLSDIKEDDISLYLKDGIYPHCKIKVNDTVLDITAPGKLAAISAAATFKAAAFIGCDARRIAKALENAFCFGQREIVKCSRAVIIDYAYEAEQLEALLTELKCYSAERIICVFGAVGGRCEYRRAALGRTACRHSDICIITSDDPEHEDQGRIARHILTNADTDKCRVIIENDRRTAIEMALSISGPSDIIVIAGKGHERTNSEKGVISPFDERKIILKYAEKYIL